MRSSVAALLFCTSVASRKRSRPSTRRSRSSLTIPSALSNRVVALVALGRHDEVLDACDRVLAVNPRDAETLYIRGNTLWSFDKLEEALESYEQAWALNHARALSMLALYRLTIADWTRVGELSDVLSKRIAEGDFHLSLHVRGFRAPSARSAESGDELSSRKPARRTETVRSFDRRSRRQAADCICVIGFSPACRRLGDRRAVRASRPYALRDRRRVA